MTSLRGCLTAKWLLLFLCWGATIQVREGRAISLCGLCTIRVRSDTQGMVVNGFVNVVITTLERRFGLASTTTGVVAGAYDLGSMLAVVPVSYFGGRLGASKPK